MIKFINNTDLDFSQQCICIILGQDKTISAQVAKIDTHHNNIISMALQKDDFFSAKYGCMKTLTLPVANGFKTVVLIGAGEVAKLDHSKLEELGARIFHHASRAKAKDLLLSCDVKINNLSSQECAAIIALGVELGSYKFYKYKTSKDKKEPSLTLDNVALSLDAHLEANELYRGYYKPIAEGIKAAKDVVNEPSNVVYPESYANIILEQLQGLNVKVKILSEDSMDDLGMHALLGVGRGSTKESKLVVMEYRGKDSSSAPLAFVGKGVTFDTGGICLKPSNGMWKMKYDMAGSAAVFGLMKSLALRKAKVNAIGVVGLVENMPGGNAQKPGDVVKTMSGQTVEVIDTDAEGRLVLADAMWYTQENYKPSIMIDLATLTGAITVALGSSYAGLFSNNDALTKHLIEAGIASGEKLWHMPLCEDYINMIKSDIADLANLGNQRGAAGSSTAAQFLEKFTNNTHWAHLDIAGVAWDEQNKGGASNKGATAFGIRLLNQLIKDHYE